MRTAILAWLFASCCCPIEDDGYEPCEMVDCDAQCDSMLGEAWDESMCVEVGQDGCETECWCCTETCGDDRCHVWIAFPPCEGRPNHRPGDDC